jgi:peptidoglycan/xylan/chitin deacetylase (PgdA/CDA1 family)
MTKRGAVLGAAAALAAWGVIRGRRACWALPAAHGALLIPTLRRNCDWFGPVATHFETENREVWLTIDDGPTERDTPPMLDLLDQFGARATFFCIGRQVDRHRALTREIRNRGHGVGNHTYQHPSGMFWALPPRMIREEVTRCSHAIRCACGSGPEYFRSPVGMTNASVHPAIEREGLRLVGWTAAGVDGLSERGDVVVRRIERRLRPGAIIVLHEGGAPGRVETLALLLSKLDALGCRCVPPDRGALRQEGR